MIDKLIIPKTILQSIADAIRFKTGDSSTIQVKDMPIAIQNIPSGGGGAKLQTNLESAIVVTAEHAKLDGKLNATYTEADTHENVVYVDGVVGKATLLLEGKKEGSDGYEDIDSLITERDGTFSANIGDYNKYKITFDGTENINALSETISEDYIIFTTNSESDTLIATLQRGEDLRVYKNGELVHNEYGQITVDVTPETDTQFIYRGLMTELEGEYDEVKHIETHADIQEIWEFPRSDKLETIVFYDPCSFEETPLGFAANQTGLKMIRFPASLKTILNDCLRSSNNLEYCYVPAVNAIDSNFMGNNNLYSLEIGSGINMEISYSTFNFNEGPYPNMEHLILPGESVITGLPENFSYGTAWCNALHDNLPNRRLSFAADTKRVLDLNSQLNGFYHIHFPAVCEKIDARAFIDLRADTNNIVLWFEGLVPPQMGETNNPGDVFNTINHYTVICPSWAYDSYYELFSGAGDFWVVARDDEDYPTENDNGEFSIDIVGKHIESNIDVWNDVFYDAANENYYYLDGVLQKDVETEETKIYNGGRIDYQFSHYGRHTLTVAGGFTGVQNGAFKNNKELVKFRFPFALESVGDKAFYGCSNLRTLVFREAPPTTIGNGAFDELHPDCTVYVPLKDIGDYRAVSALSQYHIVPYTDYIE